MTVPAIIATGSHRFEQAKKDQKKANERFHRLADARAGWPRYPGLRTLTRIVAVAKIVEGEPAILVRRGGS